jgi:urate oxidase
LSFVLGENRYGKAETHLVRISKGGEPGAIHEIRDVTVSIALSGDFAASHLEGDNSQVLPTDTQKNTVFAFAKEAPVGEIEEFGLRLARHFACDFDAVSRARVVIEEQPWHRVSVDGRPHPHSFEQRTAERRLAIVTCTPDQSWVVSGIPELVVLKSTASEFWGFPRDSYTTLQETHDRVLATRVAARWRHQAADSDWGRSFATARTRLVETFASLHSLALQQTLYAMGEAVLKADSNLAEIRLEMRNMHHFVVDLSPFQLQNDNEVFYAADRPYGLIEGTVRREGAPPADSAW